VEETVENRRVSANLEELQEKNWREIEPGDLVWYVPNPDEEGMVKLDDVIVGVVAKSSPIRPPREGCLEVQMIGQSCLLTSYPKSNLFLALSEDEVAEDKRARGLI
jgi:hypothetical protein